MNQLETRRGGGGGGGGVGGGGCYGRTATEVVKCLILTFSVYVFAEM